MQSTQWPDAPNGDGNLLGHSTDDAPVQEDPTTGHVANVDQQRALVSPLAATKPDITNVPPSTTPTIFVGNYERILAWVFVQPATGFGVEYHGERSAYLQSIASSARRLRADLALSPST